MDDSPAVTEGDFELSDRFTRFMNQVPYADDEPPISLFDSDVSDQSDHEEEDQQEPTTLSPSLMGLQVSISKI